MVKEAYLPLYINIMNKRRKYVIKLYELCIYNCYILSTNLFWERYSCVQWAYFFCCVRTSETVSTPGTYNSVRQLLLQRRPRISLYEEQLKHAWYTQPKQERKCKRNVSKKLKIECIWLKRNNITIIK